MKLSLCLQVYKQNNFFILYAKYSHTGYTDFFVHLERKIEEHPIGTDSNFIRNHAWKMNK